jgi:hypothetical protein
MQSIGAKDDGAATTDTGTFSQISLLKRLLGKTTGGPRAGVSSNAVVGVASTQIVAAGAYSGQVTIQNTSTAAQNVHIAIGAAATLLDFKLVPGASITLPFGPTNAIFAIASAAAGAVAIIGS